MARTVTSGPLAVQTKETDGTIWIPAVAGSYTVGTWTQTRVAANNWAMVHSDADDTSIIHFDLTRGLLGKYGTDPTTAIGKSHDIRGFQLKSISVIYKCTTTALDAAMTYTLAATTYANAVAPSVATAVACTDDFVATAAATPYIATITVTTPFVLGLSTQYVQHSLDLTVNAAVTSVVTMYGLFLNVNYNLL